MKALSVDNAWLMHHFSIVKNKLQRFNQPRRVFHGVLRLDNSPCQGGQLIRLGAFPSLCNISAIARFVRKKDPLSSDWTMGVSLSFLRRLTAFSLLMEWFPYSLDNADSSRNVLLRFPVGSCCFDTQGKAA